MTGTHQLAGTRLRHRTAAATGDDHLRTSLRRALGHFGEGRERALARLDEPEGLRRAARRIRADVLADLPEVLARLADRFAANGGHVCWAPDAAAANRYIADVARRTGARRVVKSKSMATEETGLNDALEEAGLRVVETDLGEWIVQLADETPSHLIAPAVHRDRHQAAEVLERVAGHALDPEPAELAGFARRTLREEYLRADLGVSGVNLAVAETGSLVLVTNEGNASLTMGLPRVHVAVMGMERVAATWPQAELLLSLLARSATGQQLTAYTDVISGPRGPGEVDGPDEVHLVILDNGRSEILASELHEILACIRCGACLNVCPVYRQVGGHAYGWVYSGPVGAVLTPLLARHHAEAAELANASTLCGACMDACPVGIPLQDLLLALRRRNAAHAGPAERLAWRAWSALWSRPAGYRASTRALTRGRRVTEVESVLPGLARWSQGRAPVTPARRTFRERWAGGER